MASISMSNNQRVWIMNMIYVRVWHMCITNQLAYHRESSYSFFSKTSLFVFPVLINQLGKKKTSDLRLQVIRFAAAQWFQTPATLPPPVAPLHCHPPAPSAAAEPGGGLGDFCGSFHGKVTRRPPSSPTQLLRDFEGISIPSPVKLYIQLGRSTKGLGI